MPDYWIQVSVGMPRHPKTEDMMESTGASRSQVAGSLVCLWTWAATYAADGNVSRFSARQLASAADWPLDAETFKRALLHAGYLDPDCTLHDWPEHQARLLELQERADDRGRALNAERQARWRARHVKDSNVTPDPSNVTGPVTSNDAPKERNVTENERNAARLHRNANNDMTGQTGQTGPNVTTVTSPVTVPVHESVGGMTVNGLVAQEQEEDAFGAQKSDPAPPSQGLIARQAKAVQTALLALYYPGAEPGPEREDVRRAAWELAQAKVEPGQLKALRELIHEAFPRYKTVPMHVLAKYSYLLVEAQRPPPGLPLPEPPEPHGPPVDPQVVERDLAALAHKFGIPRKGGSGG